MAMAALTLDHLSGGRFVLGLGASGPQVAEGWYGDDYRSRSPAPASTSQIVRQVLAREAPVEFHGERYQLPFDGGTGLGKPLKSITHPRRADLPIYLAAEGPKNVALAAEIADGWLPMFYAPRQDEFLPRRDGRRFRAVRARAARPTRSRSRASCRCIIADDVEAAADMYRPMLALYIGGMGAREVNFHNNVFGRMGYEGEAKHIQDLYLDGKKNEAAAAVPTQLVEDVALIGPKREDPRRSRDVEDVAGHDDDRFGRVAPAARHRRARPWLRWNSRAEEARVLGVLDGESGHDPRQLSVVGQRAHQRVQPDDEPRSGGVSTTRRRWSARSNRCVRRT